MAESEHSELTHTKSANEAELYMLEKGVEMTGEATAHLGVSAEADVKEVVVASPELHGDEVAAAEAAIGLAIIVVYYRNSGTIRVEEIDKLKG